MTQPVSAQPFMCSQPDSKAQASRAEPQQQLSKATRAARAEHRGPHRLATCLRPRKVLRSGSAGSSAVSGAEPAASSASAELCTTTKGASASHLQMGHSGLRLLSHWSMHSTWYRWWQGRILSLSPSLHAAAQSGRMSDRYYCDAASLTKAVVQMQKDCGSWFTDTLMQSRRLHERMYVAALARPHL